MSRALSATADNGKNGRGGPKDQKATKGGKVKRKGHQSNKTARRGEERTASRHSWRRRAHGRGGGDYGRKSEWDRLPRSGSTMDQDHPWSLHFFPEERSPVGESSTETKVIEAATMANADSWFMSSINDTKEKGKAEYLHFPSEETSVGRLLYVAWNGMMNSCTLAPTAALPRNAKLLGSPSSPTPITVMTTYSMGWRRSWRGTRGWAAPSGHRGGCCVRGVVRSKLASLWIRSLMEATFGRVAINQIG
ncbi:hypothetical protein Cni_G04223 [Canna indica]|uniref:Uncharacterized protein n=1 Tax=Canna indica TaxID=4628 RepID=A0AAQ3JVK2_9LILI|nr:hypothetical protein Cni_G04223 [Canna indica]